jgi:hypothetical protein
VIAARSDAAKHSSPVGTSVKIKGPDHTAVKLTAKAALIAASRLNEAVLGALIEEAKGRVGADELPEPGAGHTADSVDQ